MAGYFCTAHMVARANCSSSLWKLGAKIRAKKCSSKHNAHMFEAHTSPVSSSFHIFSQATHVALKRLKGLMRSVTRSAFFQQFAKLQSMHQYRCFFAEASLVEISLSCAVAFELRTLKQPRKPQCWAPDPDIYCDMSTERVKGSSSKMRSGSRAYSAWAHRSSSRRIPEFFRQILTGGY
jgi:hypothetical protein